MGMMINRRRAYGGKSLPYDAEIEYLKSTGTQYINTLFAPTSSTEIEATFLFENQGRNDRYIYTSWDSSNAVFAINVQSNGLRIFKYSTNGYFYKGGMAPFTKYTIKVARNTVIVNGVSQSFSGGNYPSEIISKMNLFGNGASYACNAAIYEAKRWENGVLFQHFIPVRVGNVGYMYDKVSGQLFGKAIGSTGDFILGPDKVKLPSKYTQVEYLESTGTLFINTNIIPNENTGVYVMAMDCHTSERFDGYTVGLRDDNNNTRWCLGCSDNGWYWGYGTYDKFNNGVTYPNELAEITLNYLNDKKTTLNVESSSYTRSVNLPNLSFTPQNQIRIFGGSGISTDYSVWSGKIYNIKISLGSNIVMDLIPVRVNQVGYMYDKVSRQLFGNQGTGDFILGPDIIEVEYLESTGYPYIDTGIQNDSDTIIDMKMSAVGKDRLNGSEYDSGYRYKWGANGSGYIYYGFDGNNHSADILFSLDTPYTFYLKLGQLYVKDSNDNTILSSSDSFSTFSNLTIRLFRCMSGGNLVNLNGPGSIRIYYCNITNSTTNLLLIPVRIGLIGYLYDKVSGKLFGNSGSGDFIFGPDKI